MLALKLAARRARDAGSDSAECAVLRGAASAQESDIAAATLKAAIEDIEVQIYGAQGMRLMHTQHRVDQSGGGPKMALVRAAPLPASCLLGRQF